MTHKAHTWLLPLLLHQQCIEQEINDTTIFVSERQPTWWEMLVHIAVGQRIKKIGGQETVVRARYIPPVRQERCAVYNQKRSLQSGRHDYVSTNQSKPH